MPQRRPRLLRERVVLALALSVLPLVVTVAPAAAADQAPVPAPRPAKPDFLFSTPTRTLSVRASWLMPSEQSDIFGFVRDQLTVEKGDFRTFALAADLGFALSPRLSIVSGIDFGQAKVPSESRHYIGSDGTPITQHTTLASAAVNGSLKVALVDPGRRIGNYAWIPRGITPFVGAGGGIRHYSFTQGGSFVDEFDLSVFDDRFKSSGWGPTAHVFGGADIAIWRGVLLTAAGRYVWSHANLGDDFAGFEPIDLSGFRMETGVSILF